MSSAIENLALRQQLAVFHASKKRLHLRRLDRIFSIWLSRLWSNWRSALLIVQPDTVVRWHQQGFRLYWRWKSRKKTVGRPKVEAEIRNLIRRMCRENPSWGAPRIYSELQLLGFDVSETTVDKYMIRHRKLPSQTWGTFLDNHLRDIVGVDSFTMPFVEHASAGVERISRRRDASQMPRVGGLHHRYRRTAPTPRKIEPREQGEVIYHHEDRTHLSLDRN